MPPRQMLRLYCVYPISLPDGLSPATSFTAVCSIRSKPREPTERKRQVFRHVRDEISRRVREFLDELHGSSGPGNRGHVQSNCSLDALAHCLTGTPRSPRTPVTNNTED